MKRRATLPAMDAAEEVIEAARDRAAALVAADADRLRELLHERFRWTSHTGESFDRAEYIHRNTDGRWRAQDLTCTRVTVVGDTAVLHADVVDAVGDGAETFRMPMTQVWVRVAGRWTCLAGHAGPRRT